jgi:hypothetical protein
MNECISDLADTVKPVYKGLHGNLLAVVGVGGDVLPFYEGRMLDG